MRDRTPAPGKANRVKITQDDGTVIEGVLAYADDATQDGSAYTKGNVLPDDVCGVLGIDPVSSEPKDAWLGVIKALGYAILTIKAYKVDGTPFANEKVSGLTGVVESRTYTDENGAIWLIIEEGTYNLSLARVKSTYDASVADQQAVVVAGQQTDVVFQQVSTGATSVRISSSRSIKFSDNAENIDIFVVGGGGGGQGGSSWGTTSTNYGGNGGGGGRTATVLNAQISRYTDYQITIGAGGRGGNGYSGSGSGTADDGTDGGITSFGNVVSASGGDAGTSSGGGDGGSGGGGGGGYHSSGGDGGSDGRDGEGAARPGGSGQGTTTRAFKDPDGIQCAGGGAGGGGYSGTTGPGTNGDGSDGSGGRGGEGGVGSNGRAGTKGVCMIRWVNRA